MGETSLARSEAATGDRSQCEENMETFAVLWEKLKDENENGQFEYSDSERPFSHLVRHKLKDKDGHGVYVVIGKESGQVIYIGKGGTISNNGDYQSQDIKGRLTAERGKKPADVWFADLVEQYGPITVEYVFLPDQRQSCAAYVEACLLQAYLREKGRLPAKNKEF
jgi:hypothetical protein